MHCMPLRTATLMLVARHRTMAWQSLLSRVVRAPTSSCRGGADQGQKALAHAVLCAGAPTLPARTACLCSAMQPLSAHPLYLVKEFDGLPH